MWGSDEVNVEGWKPLKRLPGHESGEYMCSSIGAFINVSQTSRTSHGPLATDTSRL